MQCGYHASNELPLVFMLRTYFSDLQFHSKMIINIFNAFQLHSASFSIIRNWEKCEKSVFFMLHETSNIR